eukprot:CAMPEP_0181120130 /NCGR_PEP_ID=MMETSP1071-20121207/23981_1 /TAXON_ID=35127 /ORGANISM="Thalassiosira sp., Strain NH16" /LENGTH=486 /DNA_ID=CAMNT_0023204743 /DNA_START=148 /DNA_END=1608 /DNA_ORIENTATION=+
MAQPGSSAVYFGGTVSYNTRKARPLLLNDAKLHEALVRPLTAGDAESEEGTYVRSKIEHTERVALSYCEQMGTDYAVAESGASGPTFTPAGLDRGFAAIAVAKRNSQSGEVSIVKQDVIQSTHNDRQINMRMFADGAAGLLFDAVQEDAESNIKESFRQADGEKYHFDRATKLRADADELSKLAKDGKYVVLRGGQSLFGDGFELKFLSHDEVQSICNATGCRSTTTFLGILDGKQAYFGADLIGGSDDSVNDIFAKDEEGAHFSDTRTGAPLLSAFHNELALHATALSQWQRRSAYCPISGSKTELIDGGTSMQSTSNGAKSWPRQDPSMIAAITSRDGDSILLAHSSRHPPKLHTVLAGFIEAGETFEKGVAREAFEETGIRIDEDSVEYIGSQPWPFPQSTMIGFMATADASQPLNIDEDEIVHARWFHKDEVRLAAAVEGTTMRKEVAKEALDADPTLPLLIPPKGVIARTLIDTWLKKLPL